MTTDDIFTVLGDTLTREIPGGDIESITEIMADIRDELHELVRALEIAGNAIAMLR